MTVKLKVCLHTLTYCPKFGEYYKRWKWKNLWSSKYLLPYFDRHHPEPQTKEPCCS